MSLRVAIVGATGLVGEELLQVLAERRFPVGALSLYASERSAGQVLTFAGQPTPVQLLDPEAAAAHDVVFLSAGATLSRELRPILETGGALVLDNSSAFRMAEDVPLVVPECNADQVRAGARYYAVPNCTTILLVLALSPLHRSFGLRRVVVSTFQAISGAGRRATLTLLDHTRQELDHPGSSPADSIAFNAFPSIGPASEFADGDRTGEEIKVGDETRRILGVPQLAVTATCVRIPVLRAHSESVHVELERETRLEEVREILRSCPWIHLRDSLGSGDVPTPRQASGIDGIDVGRLRLGDRRDHLDFFLCGDQLRKGAALNAVQIAELCLARSEVPDPGVA